MSSSVKGVCEEEIIKGTKKGVLLSKLRKKFDKDDATYEKSIKYYASALCRDDKIDEEAKAGYFGKSKVKSSRSTVSKGNSKKDKPTKGKSKSKASSDAPAKNVRKKRSAKAAPKVSGEKTSKVKKGKKSKAQS